MHKDVIEVEGLRLRCRIGCSTEERRDLSDVVIGLKITTDACSAGDSDRLEDAWNYRTPTKAIITAVETSEFYTVEALATSIARIVVLDHGAPSAQVRVTKPAALRFADTVSITLTRISTDFTSEAEVASS